MKSYIRGILIVFLLGLSVQIFASNAGMVSGTITDSLGAVVPNAKVELLENEMDAVAQTTKSDANGHYSFSVAHEGRFHVRAEAVSFQPAISGQKFVDKTHSTEINLTLSPSIVAQEIVVSATGVPTPESQTGASISVVNEESLATRRDVEQELRLIPGAQVTRTGQIGGAASLYVRGGPSDANKVLIDGVTANDIGGTIDFANLNASGFEKAEVFRGPNSALYGSDALASVVNLSTRRGVTPLPELGYSVDGGTYGTYHQDGNLGGTWKRLDYFTNASRFDTQNSTPNSEFHNGSFLGNIGLQILPGTELRGTVRRSVSALNAADAVSLYVIPDDGVSREQDTSFGVTLENRANERWHNLVRYSGLRFRSEYTNAGPTGIAYDPDNTGYPIYLGETVTLRGANGYQVTGQGVLQYGPGAYATSVLSNRDSVYAQSDFRWNSKLAGLFGFRYESEGGYTNYGYAKPSTTRGNYSYIMQLNGGFWNRLYYTVGSGLENNAVFGFAATPRASLAYYLVKPHETGVFNGTRLAFNFGKGVKEPSIYYETNSLYRLLQSLPNGQQLITQNGIRPFNAELSRTYDGGVQQTLFHGKARVTLTYFHNEFGDQAEFVPVGAFSELGVSQPVIEALSGAFLTGAAVNSLSYSAQGTELEAEYHIKRNLTVRGGWTYTDAVVQRSFASSAFQAAYNPLFPNIPIGAFSPLVGARPFRIAPHTGYVAAEWGTGRWLARVTGSFVSRRDDSDFLYDKNFYYDFGANDNTMLLPNRNLDAGYQKVDLFGSFQVTKRLSVYSTIENMLNQHYYEAFGYPALPFTIRSGLQFRLGGESWKLQ
jgi:iron complex outermembrane receptor protein/vitamin B12 transporter